MARRILDLVITFLGWSLVGYGLMGILSALLSGCSVDTRPPEDRPVRWYYESLTVCSELIYEQETIAAAVAWYVGPELVYVGECGEANVAVISGVAAGGGEAETVIDYGRVTHAIQRAVVYMDVKLPLDVQSVVTHELGHALGLPDSDVHEATMFGWIGTGEVRARDISATDVEAIEELYGK